MRIKVAKNKAQKHIFCISKGREETFKEQEKKLTHFFFLQEIWHQHLFFQLRDCTLFSNDSVFALHIYIK